jgi:hypothetical protein
MGVRRNEVATTTAAKIKAFIISLLSLNGESLQGGLRMNCIRQVLNGEASQGWLESKETSLRWSRLFGQIFRLDKWIVYRV